jgi:hypothetical protein
VKAALLFYQEDYLKNLKYVELLERRAAFEEVDSDFVVSFDMLVMTYGCASVLIGRWLMSLSSMTVREEKKEELTLFYDCHLLRHKYMPGTECDMK